MPYALVCGFNKIFAVIKKILSMISNLAKTILECNNQQKGLS
jgi:hypothetical protein